MSILFLTSMSVFAAPSDGAARQKDSSFEVFDGETRQWLSPRQFWSNYVKRESSGKYWGSAASYPPYAEVAEFDTFLVKVPEGECLMEFFHSRWRRAQDVERWNEYYNQYSGCPFVFD